MQKLKLTIPVLAAALCTLASATGAQTLKGSPASVNRQNREALGYGYTFLETPKAVNEFVAAGYLVSLDRNGNYELHAVSYPYARPEVKLFVERLSAQYRNACGERMTVTSLTRPIAKQPANAAEKSVHPTGMAVDLRIPSKRSCRSWLENTLLALEGNGVLDVTQERNPPHYHVAVFTKRYESYVAALQGTTQEYLVRNGDSLWSIANRNGTTVAALRSANSLGSDLLQVGQKLQIPAIGSGPAQVAAAPAVVETVAVAEPQEVSHKVRRGETLWRIARRYGSSVDHLRSENGLAGDLLQVGQVLRVRIMSAD